MEFPITLLEFMEQFPDDDACRRYLEKIRLTGVNYFCRWATTISAGVGFLFSPLLFFKKVTGR